MQNIILVGMPGSGKSTLGQMLAEQLRYHYIDTDEVIMETYHADLMGLIQAHGTEGFIELEGSVISSIYTNIAVISTGGSAIYHEGAMAHLKSLGFVVYLYHALSDLQCRVGDMTRRGVVCRKECMTLEELYIERCPLYETYADLTVDMTGKSIMECSDTLLHAVQKKIEEIKKQS